MPGMTFEHGLELWKVLLEFIRALAWPMAFLVTITIFHKNLSDLLGSVRQAHLPWGAGTVEFEKEVADLSVQANQPDQEKLARRTSSTTESNIENYNEAVIERGLQPTRSGLDLNYFRKIASDDPNLALAALRMEIETMLSNLAIGFDVPVDQRQVLSRMLDSLRNASAITTQQYQTARKVIDLCNRAIHGQSVDTATALTVIESVRPLLDDYRAWLQWGFPEQGTG